LAVVGAGGTRILLDRTCPLGCGRLSGDGAILRDNRFGLPHTITIGWCGRCGLGVTLDPPSRDELNRLYAETYADAEHAGRVPRTGLAARVWHRANGSLPLTDRALEPPVLDVGANTGEALLALRERGIQAVGLEPNPRAAAIAAGQGFEVIVAPVEEADLAERQFGSVLLSQVLEHVEDPEAVLGIVRRALREGGTAYAVVPNTTSVWRSVFGPQWVHWHVPFHLFHHTPSSLRLLFDRAGFEVRRLTNVTPGEWLLMSLQAARNARRGMRHLEHFEGRYGRRLLVAPPARLFDALGRGDALVVEAVRKD
jgi:SAM-dependent methyltransferase